MGLRVHPVSEEKNLPTKVESLEDPPEVLTVVRPLCAAGTEDPSNPWTHVQRKEAYLRLEDFRRKKKRASYLVSMDRRSKSAVSGPKRKRETNPPDSKVYHTTVRLSYSEVSVKLISELALYAVGKYLWEDSAVSLEDYYRLEFLLTWLLGSKKNIGDIKDKKKQDLVVLISLILKYAERSFEPTIVSLSKKRLQEMMVAKVGPLETLSARAHGARSYIWSVRYELWLELRSEGEDDNQIRGIRYSSYTKGYHDGSTLRPNKAERSQILDRQRYSQVQFGIPNLEIWDPEEYRKNL